MALAAAAVAEEAPRQAALQILLILRGPGVRLRTERREARAYLRTGQRVTLARMGLAVADRRDSRHLLPQEELEESEEMASSSIRRTALVVAAEQVEAAR